MPLSETGLKKGAIVTVGTLGVGTFASAVMLQLYWAGSRRLPDPALGRVIVESNKGHKYYLTEGESRVVSEPVFIGAVMLVFFAGFLNQRWNSFKR
jgi:hypothetical protein